MEEEFWEYSKKIYAQSYTSFLWLQDRRSLDVNLLLFCYWLGKKGRRLSIEEVIAAVRMLNHLDNSLLYHFEVRGVF